MAVNERVAQAINERIDELHRPLSEVIAKSGLSREQWQRLRRGQVAANPQMVTRRGVADGLDWPINALETVMRGEPVEVDRATMAQDEVRQIARRLDAIENALSELLSRQGRD